MFPFDRKDREPQKSIFGDFGGLFADFDEIAKKMMDDAGRNGLVYGYQSFTGPDGVPHVREFSNVPGFAGQGAIEPQAGSCPTGTCQSQTDKIQLGAPQDTGVCAPYHDVLEDGDAIKVIVDMPGIEKKDIKVKAKGHTVSIDAVGSSRTYAKTIGLPQEIAGNPKSAIYKNGVLELTYDRTSEPTDIKVE